MNPRKTLPEKLALVNRGISNLSPSGIAKIRQLLTITAEIWNCSYVTYYRSRSSFGKPEPYVISLVDDYLTGLDQEGSAPFFKKLLKEEAGKAAASERQIPFLCIGAKVSLDQKYFGTFAFSLSSGESFNEEDQAILQLIVNSLAYEEYRLSQQRTLNDYTERIDIIFETIPIMMFLVDRNLSIFSINRQVIDELGYSSKELVGYSLLKIFNPESHAIVRSQVKLCFDNPANRFSWEVQKQKKSGESIWVKEKAQLFTMSEGLELLLILCDDITERKLYHDRIFSLNIELENRVLERTAQLQLLNTELENEISARQNAEATLLISKNLVDEATKLAHLGSFEFHYDTSEIICSAEFKRIFNLPENDEHPEVSALLDMITPEQREIIWEAGKTIKTGDDFYNGELVLTRPDGRELTIAVNLRALVRDGIMVGLFGTIQDITEQKLVAQQMSIMANAISSLTDTVIVTDTAEVIKYVNKAFTKSYGYTEQEVVGKHINMVRSEKNPPQCFLDITRMTMLTGWQGELINIRKDGTEFPVYLTTSKVTDQHGNIIALVGVSRDIGNEKKANEALIRSEEKFRSLFENVHDVFFIIERDGTISEISPSAHHYFEKSRDEIIGMNVRDGFLYDNSEILKLGKKLLSDKEFFDYEMKFRGVNDLLLYTSCNARATFDTTGHLLRIEGTFRDITDRKAAENALRKQVKIEEFLAAISSKFINLSMNEVYKTIYESLETLGKFTNSGNVTIALVKQFGTLSKTFTWSKKNIVPKSHSAETISSETLHEFFVAEHTGKPVLLRYSKKNKYSGNKLHDYLRSTGFTAAFLLPLSIRKKYSGYLGFFYTGSSRNWMNGDVSYLSFIAEIFSQLFERKMMEDELIDAKKLAEESSRTKEQFLAHMSHELRTPLNAIIGSTYLLERTLPNAKQIEYLDTIRISADSLLSLVNDILDYSRIKAGKVEFKKVDFSLEQIVQMAYKIARIQAEHKSLSISNSIAPNVPAVLFGDPERLSQILINLLANAVKYTDSGSVSLTVELEKQDVDVWHILFTIKDTGIGISKQNQKIIFDDFTRSRSPQSKMRDGTGLGLSICKNLVSQFGGRIEIESKTGKGSTFRVHLPFASPVNKTIIHFEHSSGLLSGSLKDVKVLVVEDNEFNRLIIRDLMHVWKADCRLAIDGESAYELLQNEDFAIVLLDLGLPLMSGFDLARLIRTSLPLKRRSIPLLALTAVNTREEQKTPSHFPNRNY
ncbi:MAG: PAS domain S-box protein [Ignavibacteriales bacterium]|nr:PAS domain S-box protein [Ignavibacteriales bacterium]